MTAPVAALVELFSSGVAFALEIYMLWKKQNEQSADK